MHTDRLDEIYLRAAANLMRDAVEADRSPSGMALDRDVTCLYELAAHRLDAMVHGGLGAARAADDVCDQNGLLCLSDE